MQIFLGIASCAIMYISILSRNNLTLFIGILSFLMAGFHFLECKTITLILMLSQGVLMAFMIVSHFNTVVQSYFYPFIFLIVILTTGSMLLEMYFKKKDTLKASA